ncbi:MAG: beta-N-acetylhexosaminidase [Pseudomonadota bacterium]
MEMKALICGVAGLSLLDSEVDFIARHRPWGFILFGRNVDTPEQVRALTAQLRQASQRDSVPILVDQEGGRVQRLKPPHWRSYPAAQVLGDIYAQDAKAGLRATWLVSRLHAFDLGALGIYVDCLPVLDVPVAGSHNVIGNRAYATKPDLVARLGRAACDGVMAGGVQPVIKHIPGHGRAMADSHHDLPVVETDRATLEATDFAPFAALNSIPMAMTAHVIYTAIDPNQPATTSPIVMDEIVRGHMGYDGLVMCDDITMGALSGDLASRTRATLSAGCDIVLHCTGKLDEMEEVAQANCLLGGEALARAERALEGMGPHGADTSVEAYCRVELDEILGRYAPTLVAGTWADPTNYGRT